MKNLQAKDLAAYIDHTLLKPESTETDLRRLCAEARELSFFAVCVNSSYVPLVTQELQGSSVKVVSVIGFPLGAMASAVKAQEAEYALKNGADEIDMVLPLGFLKAGNMARVREDIATVAQVCKQHCLKVILETGLLTMDEKKTGCRLSVEAGAHFVKTCTGFAVGKAEISDIQLMRQIVGPHFGVKASGGIKSTESAIALIQAGANRLGTSSGPALVKNQIQNQNSGPSGY